jgi:hypothetical protein
MRHFKNCHLAQMSDGHYCVIRTLGPVKGGKGLKHHEVIVDFTWRALVRFLSFARRCKTLQTDESAMRPPTPTVGKNCETGDLGDVPLQLNVNFLKVRDSH